MREVMTLNISNGEQNVERITVWQCATDSWKVTSRRISDGAETGVADYRTASLHGAISNAFSRGGFDVPNIASIYKNGDKHSDPPMTVEELIAEADESFGDWRESCKNPENPTTIEACEFFYMNGVADDVGGDVEFSTGHFYRVARWIVVTDSQGFHNLIESDTDADAIKEIEKLNELDKSEIF